eukprot:2143158-Pleurochrysis_carterae.AAC.1
MPVGHEFSSVCLCVSLPPVIFKRSTPRNPSNAQKTSCVTPETRMSCVLSSHSPPTVHHSVHES